MVMQEAKVFFDTIAKNGKPCADSSVVSTSSHTHIFDNRHNATIGAAMPTPIVLTPAAGGQLARIQANAGAQGVRIALKKGGCAGMEYTLDALHNIPKGATIVEAYNAVLVVDPLAEMFLFGTEIDYKDDLLEAGFTFTNPNVKSACGCGASVSF